MLSYKNAYEHLLDELRWLNRLLAGYVLRLRSVKFYEDLKAFTGLFIADEEIDALLAKDLFDRDEFGKAGTNGSEMQKARELTHDLRKEIDLRIIESLEANIFLPFQRLAQCFQLNRVELHALLICIAPAIDVRYSKLYAYLQNQLNKKYPTKDLIIGLLMEKPEERIEYCMTLDSASPLIKYGLVEVADGENSSSVTDSEWRADPKILQYILCKNRGDERLKRYVQLFPPLKWSELIIPDAVRRSLQDLFNYELSEYGNVCIYLHGREGVGKKAVARALCGKLGLSLAVIDVSSLPRSLEEFCYVVRRSLREGLLSSHAVCFHRLERLLSLGEEYPGLILALTEALQELGWITFLCSASPLPVEMLSKANIYPVEIPPPDVEGQIALWKMHLESIAAELNAMDLSQLVSQFNLTGGQILNAIKRAEKIAHVRDPYRTRLDIQDLSSSSRTESQPRLTALARKVEPRYGWQDLVLPESHMSQLHEIASQAKHRHRVMRDWGFGKKMALGRGLNALFAGSSGTGKTMAAEVIGYELGLDIYKIDLSAVVSKYIGETEKNLNRLFNEAEHSNAILFFDEADALFGKRSEVKDAHDRYANIEVGFLLQKMEEYEGITILSSNLRRNIDEAFVRRIQFIIDFPFPDATHREMIWRKTFPEKAPLDADVDFTFLATKFKLTGGHIRNIGLRSSYYAAEANGAITMAHVVRATKRELQKMGKLYTEAEFGDYGEAQD